MKKVLGLVLTLTAVVALSFGTIGCGKDKDKKSPASPAASPTASPSPSK